MIHVLEKEMGQQVDVLWHKDTDLPGFDSGDCIVLPGGFAYGDYLRAGAIARFSPIMDSVVDFAKKGGKVLGVCNGFQVLCEAGLLEGALLRNSEQLFICKNIYVRAINVDTSLTRGIDPLKALKIPISHAEGRYFNTDEGLRKLVDNDQILFKYCDKDGNFADSANPNGSMQNIAGICNSNKNVFGLMPHPERAAEEVLGNTDGRVLFESLLSLVSV